MNEPTTTPQATDAVEPKAANPKKPAKKAAAKKPAARKTAASKTAASGRSLVIVESPAKARTIEKYLGRKFKVLASVGHVIDLPKSTIGVDIENNFTPEYVTIRGKKKVLDDLKKAASTAPAIYLATDPDREGEAIAWHVANYLKIKDKPVYRATFNEITKTAVKEALDAPSEINVNLCMAQQARRILDRLVGYQISPLLWRNVQRGLSAGRVQSVAVRLVCERDAEIDAFEPREYWSVEIDVEGKNPPPFHLRLAKIDNEKLDIPNKEAADKVVGDIDGQPLVVKSVEKKPHRRHPQPPFITSTLQQEAARKLRLTPRQAMAVAQGLYEGVDIGGEEGTVGLITYMRTDSTRVSDSALEGVRSFIANRFGNDYLPEKPNFYRSRKGAQDAHEAIRPTLTDHPPERLKAYLTDEQLNLYTLVWNRFVASQMTPAVMERTTIEVPLCDSKYLFVATGSVMKFPGFLAVYEEDHDAGDGKQTTKEETAVQLPSVEENETLKQIAILPEQHFTQPPPRFTMSSLVSELEKRGIGRPSTYAAILTTIQEKKYVERQKATFFATDLGKIVTEILVDSFPEVLDPAFTALMENELDEVEDGTRQWIDVMHEFYDGFRSRLDVAEKEMKSPRGNEEVTDIDCDLCGKKMVVKWGRNGYFLSCPDYPECKNAKPFTRKEDGTIEVETVPTTDEVCEKCGSPMVVKRSRRGPFLACSKYPECKSARNITDIQDGVVIAEAALPDTDEVCEKCNEKMIVRSSRRGPFIACSGYPKCRNAKAIAEIVDGKAIAEQLPTTEEKCEKCGKDMTVKKGKRGLFLACTGYPKCRNSKPMEGEEAEKAAASTKTRTPARPQPIETAEKCEACGKPMLLRSGRNGYFLACSGYPKCKTTQNAEPEIIEKYTTQAEPTA